MCVTTHFFLLAGSVVATSGPEPDVPATIRRGLVYLEREGIKWMTERRCASCHHVPMMVWTLTEAHRAGYAVNRLSLMEASNWLLAPDNRAGLMPPKVPTQPWHKELALVVAVTAVATADQPNSDDAAKVRAAFAAHVRSRQSTDGGWRISTGRKPLFGGPEELTPLALLALAATESPANPSTNDAVNRGAREFLARNSASPETQSQALAIILGTRTNEPRDALAFQIDRIWKLQRADGGFGQNPDLPSDAFATGQVLYAVGSAGVRAPDERVARAREFLRRTQKDNGAWLMISRPEKGEGKPATNLDPIIYAGTAWATLGLIRTLPR